MIDFESGVVVLDQLVKPSRPITDYLTRYAMPFLSQPQSFIYIPFF